MAKQKKTDKAQKKSIISTTLNSNIKRSGAENTKGSGSGNRPKKKSS